MTVIDTPPNPPVLRDARVPAGGLYEGARRCAGCPRAGRSARTSASS